jgi:hypothetical protein
VRISIRVSDTVYEQHTCITQSIHSATECTSDSIVSSGGSSFSREVWFPRATSLAPPTIVHTFSVFYLYYLCTSTGTKLLEFSFVPSRIKKCLFFSNAIFRFFGARLWRRLGTEVLRTWINYLRTSTSNPEFSGIIALVDIVWRNNIINYDRPYVMW